jgi:hypothetical protein
MTPEKLALIALGVSGIGLLVSIASAVIAYRAKEQTRRHTEILQRAYLSAEPGGLSRPIGSPEHGPHVVLAHVRLANVGHLPARRVSWSAQIKWELDSTIIDFPISNLRGLIALSPGTTTILGTDELTLESDKGFIYVWGQVRFDDGFGQQRFTNFCHRYNRRVLRKLERGYGIPEEDGRFHEFGNDAA